MINDKLDKVDIIKNYNNEYGDSLENCTNLVIDLYYSDNKINFISKIKDNNKIKNLFYFVLDKICNISFEINNLDIKIEKYNLDMISINKNSVMNCFMSCLKNRKLNINKFWDSEDYKDQLNNINYKKILILYGPDFSGKSYYLSQNYNIEKSIKLYLTPQTEYKNLLGNYICGKEPGNFEYKDGPLLYCIKNGYTLILENFEKCKPEILYNILKIIQENKLHHRSNKYSLHKNFSFILIINTTTEQGNEYLNFSKNYAFVYFIEMKKLDKNIINNYIKDNCLNLEKIPHFIDSFFTLLNNIQEIIYKENLKINIFETFKIFSLFKKFNIYFEDVQKSDYIGVDIQREMLIEIKNTFLEFLNYNTFKDIINKMIFPEFIKIKKLEFFSYYENLDIMIRGNNGLLKTPKYKINNKNYKLSKNNLKIINNLDDFQFINSNKIVIEKIIGCIQINDIPLLIGETGCGKTTIVQKIAEFKNIKLNIINMSKQTDISDFLGGFKPINHKIMVENLFKKTYKYLSLWSKNSKKLIYFFNSIKKLFKEKKYLTILKSLIITIDNLNKKDEANETYLIKIIKLKETINNFFENYNKIKNNVIFEYRKGILIESMENGDWLLFDEINLAENEILLNLMPVFEKKSITILEKGSLKEVKINKEFKIFCCMNPGSGVGKKNLPLEIKKRLFEINVNDIDSYDELYAICYSKLIDISNEKMIEKITKFYKQLKNYSNDCIIEESRNKKPNYSLRIFVRTLNIIINSYNIPGISLIRAIYDGIICGLGSSLNSISKQKLKELFEQIFEISYNAINKKIEQESKLIKLNPNEVIFKNYVLKKGNNIIAQEPKYLITSSHLEIIEIILQALSYSNYPILIEGLTSTGKTSLIYYLAYYTNNKIHRINNHEHTEIEEYIGQYIPSSNGNIIFQKGILVEAMENGDWLLLDELNLASSEILEALNRVLDDNREIFIPEIKKVIKPHPNFRIFATQNPTSYGGRKELSLAFQNRFIRVKFDEIKNDDLKKIIMFKNDIIETRANKLIELVKKLSNLRTTQNFFSGKESLITIRDLMKICNRGLNDYKDLAYESFFVLCERLRDIKEKKFVKKIVEEIFKQKIDENQYYYDYFLSKNLEINKHIIYDDNFKRMFSLVDKALSNNESVLLIGDAGCGKTTLAELLSEYYKIKFYSINCHKYTEASDFLGSFRPKRNKNEIIEEILVYIKNNFNSDIASNEINEFTINLKDSEHKTFLSNKIDEINCLFEFKEGPLLQSVKGGGLMLIDEISLAQDSVLEKLNSLFEIERNLVVFDYENNKSEIIKAHNSFKVISTMNPSGDFGKRELTPALRNRFTEIWVIPSTDYENLKSQFSLTNNEFNINNDSSLYNIVLKLLYFLDEKNRLFYTNTLCKLIYLINVEYKNFVKNINLRDIKTIIEFIFKTKNVLNSYDCLFESIILYLEAIKGILIIHFDYKEILSKLGYKSLKTNIVIENNDKYFKIDEYTWTKYNNNIYDNYYSLDCETVKNNLKKITKGLYLEKAILIEGPPGIGKTSIINFWANLLGKKLHRINLSEQTDISDLFGFDIPTNTPGVFKWADGQFLKSMKNGDWILLDELNLASQSVLEGLNSILDHREMVYIPELDKVFKKHPQFKIFATQNPYQENKGRKGLPLSFLSRFVRIYLENFKKEELKSISKILLNKYTLNRNEIDDNTFMEQVFYILDIYNNITNIEYNIRYIEKFFKFLNKDLSIISFINSFNIIFLSEIKDELIYKQMVNEIESYFNIDINKIIIGKNKLEFNNMKLLNDNFTNEILYGNKLCEKLIWNINFILKFNTPILINVSNKENHIFEPINIIKELAVKNDKKLTMINLFKNSDISDLIGSYEQINFIDRIKNLLKNYKNLDKNLLKSMYKSIDNNCFDYLEKLKTINISLFNEITNIINEKNKTVFKWIDSQFINSLIKGNWVVLNNCQNTNSEILERLNSILEDEEEFIISESIDENSGIKKIKKNKNFRIFLIFDERKKSLNYSLALKNRCIEINWTNNFTNLNKSLIIYEYSSLLKFNLGNFNYIFDNVINSNNIDLDNFFSLIYYNRIYENYIKNSINNLYLDKDLNDNLYYEESDNYVLNYEKNYFMRLINYYKVINNNYKGVSTENHKLINYLTDNYEFNELITCEFGKNIVNNYFKIFVFYQLFENKDIKEYIDDSLKSEFYNFIKIENNILSFDLDKESLNVISFEKLIYYFIYLVFTMKISFKNVYIDDLELSEIISSKFNEKCYFLNNLKPTLLKSISKLIFDKIVYIEEDLNFLNILKEFKNIIIKNYGEVLEILSQSIIINNDDDNEFESIIFVEDNNNINIVTNMLLYPEVIYEENNLDLNKKEILNYFSLEDDFLNLFRSFYQENSFYNYNKIFENENMSEIKSLFELIKYIRNSKLNYRYNKKLLDLKKNKIRLKDINLIKYLILDLENKLNNKNIINLDQIIQSFKDKSNLNYKFTNHFLFIMGLLNNLNNKEIEVYRNEIQYIFKNKEYNFENNLVNLDISSKFKNWRFRKIILNTSKMLEENPEQIISLSTKEFLKNIEKIISLCGNISTETKNLIELIENKINNQESIVNELYNLLNQLSNNTELLFYYDILYSFLVNCGNYIIKNYNFSKNNISYYYLNNNNIQNSIKSFKNLNYLNKFFYNLTLENYNTNLDIEIINYYFDKLINLSNELSGLQIKYNSKINTEAAKNFKLNKELDKMITNEYTKQAVEFNKQAKEKEIFDNFNAFEEEFSEFLPKKRRNIIKEEKIEETNYIKLQEVFHNKCIKFYNNLVFIWENSFEFFKPEINEINYFNIYLNMNEIYINDILCKKWINNKLNVLIDNNINDITISNYEKYKGINPVKRLIFDFLNEKIDNKINFYNQSNFEELNNLKDIIKILVLYLKELNDDINFRGLISVNNCFKLCTSLINIDLKSSMSKIATAYQLLYTHLGDVFKGIPSKYHNKTIYDSLLNNLRNIRKMEKSNWKSLVKGKYKQILNKDLPFTLSLIKEFSSDKKELITLIDEFIRRSNIGNFNQRISWIYLFKFKLSKENQKIVEQIICFYSNFKEEREEIMKGYQEEIEKPVKENEKLMNWHFQDIVNLKMNIQKLYKGINRSIKKQREIMEMPIENQILSPIRLKYLHDSIQNFIIFTKNIQIVKEEDKKKVVKKIFINELLGKNFDLVNIKKLYPIIKLISVKKFCILFNNKNLNQKFSKVCLIKSSFDTVINDIMNQINILKEQKNNKFKFRALDNFFKLLNEFEIKKKYNMNSFDLNKLLDGIIDWKFCDIIINKYDKSLKIKNKFEKIYNRFYKIIDLVLILQNEQKYNENIPLHYIDKTKGVLISFIIKFKNYLYHTDKIIHTINEIKKLSNLKNNKNQDTLDIKFNLIKNEAKHILLINKYTDDLSNEDINTLNSWINKKNIKIYKNTTIFKNINNLINEYLNYKNNNDFKTIEKLEINLEKHLNELNKNILLVDKEMENSGNLIKLQYDLTKSIKLFLSKIHYWVKNKNYKINNDFINISNILELHCFEHLYTFNKFIYLSCMILYNICYKGFCQVDEIEDECTGKEELHEGTGIGSGKGNQNVTNEMEFEEQVLGENDENQEEQSEESLDMNKDEKDQEEMEMENDFKGKNYDEEKEEEDKNNEKNKDKNDMDNEFDNVDNEDLDAKLFDELEEDKSDEEDDNKSKEEDLRDNDKFDINADKLDKQNEELKPKENDEDKEERNIDSVDNLSNNSKEISENEDKDGKDEDEYADVQDPSEMSSRNSNNDENYSEFNDDNKEIDKDISGSEEEEFSLKDNNENNDDQMKEEDENEEIDDALDHKERKIKDEKEKEEAQGEKLENNMLNNQENENNDDNNDNNADNIDNNDNKNKENKDNKEDDYLNEIQNQEEFKNNEEIKNFIENLKIKKSKNEKNDNEQELNGEVEIGDENEKTQTKAPNSKNTMKFDPNETLDNENNRQLVESESEEIEDNETETDKNKNINEDETNNKLNKNKESINNSNNGNINEEMVDINISLEKRDIKNQDILEINSKLKENKIEMGNNVNIQWIKSLEKKVFQLSEELRSIFIPQKISNLKGDFKTGKKLNMKKVIQFIASDYRKDKIWLRRNEPSERNYKIMIGLDNSLSMKEQNVGKSALESLLILSLALDKINVGELSICLISDTLHLLHPFDKKISVENSLNIMNSFNFEYQDTNSSDFSIKNFLQESINVFSKDQDVNKICFIVGDGIFNKEHTKPMLKKAEEENIIYVYLILDNKNEDKSILKYKTAKKINGKMVILNYLEEFPFEYYWIVKDIDSLINSISLIIKEFINRNN